MNEGIINKIKRILRFYVGRLFGKKYGCCSKTFISCKKCLNVKDLDTYEQERLREISGPLIKAVKNMRGGE